MTKGALIFLGCIALGWACSWIWRHIPIYRCPDCQSLRVEDFEAEGPTIHVCKDCGKAWKDADEV